MIEHILSWGAALLIGVGVALGVIAMHGIVYVVGKKLHKKFQQWKDRSASNPD